MFKDRTDTLIYDLENYLRGENIVNEHPRKQEELNREFEKRLIQALVKVIYESKGRRVTIRARLLLRIAGEKVDQRSIVKVSMFLKKLVIKNLIKSEIRKRFQRSRSLNYVVHEGMRLWNIAKASPQEAERLIQSELAK
ncbi:MAG: hypothetical protein GXO23_03760 [Crenarchaeota archaeon]|nr:hypothetical protein [Thermoproteota archaeon]